MPWTPRPVHSSHSNDSCDSSDSSTVRRLLLLVVLVILAMSLQVAVSTPPLHQADERAHASYATVLAHGTLPTIRTPIPDEPDRYPRLARMLQGRDAAHRSIWVANHPPLYYAMSVPLVWVGDGLGRPSVTYLGMRVLNALGFAAAVLLAALIAGELVPRRRGAMLLGTAALALSAGAIPYRAGAIYNDGIATAAAFLVIWLGLRMVRDGPAARGVAQVAVAGAAAAAARSTGLVAVVFACAAVAAAYLLRERTARGVARAGLAVAAVGGLPAAAIGWFYLRNISLYGSMTGSGALFQQFGRAPSGSTLHTLVDPQFYVQLLESLWVDELLPTPFVAVAALVALVLLLGGGMLLARARGLRRPRAEDVVVWLVVLGYSGVLVGGTASFIAGGGQMHARYALALLPLLGACFGLALRALARACRWEASRVLQVCLSASLVAGLAAHVTLEPLLYTPFGGTPGVIRAVLGDAVVAVLAAALARAVWRQPASGGVSRRDSRAAG